MSYLRCLIKRLSLRQDRRVQTGMTLCWRDEGIDKLTRRRGPALLDEDLSAQYVDASAHSERILRSEEARRSHVPVAEFVNLSVPPLDIRFNYLSNERDRIDWRTCLKLSREIMH